MAGVRASVSVVAALLFLFFIVGVKARARRSSSKIHTCIVIVTIIAIMSRHATASAAAATSAGGGGAAGGELLASLLASSERVIDRLYALPSSDKMDGLERDVPEVGSRRDTRGCRFYDLRTNGTTFRPAPFFQTRTQITTPSGLRQAAQAIPSRRGG